MATYTAEIVWTLQEGDDFLKGRYRRGHTVSFDGGVTISASASPHVVGEWADPNAVDPEEMLVAAVSSCHMLNFLHIARLAGFEITSYQDHAEGLMAEIEPGKQAITEVTLRPKIDWSGTVPVADRLSRLHEDAHSACFIANSVRTAVVIASQIRKP